LTIWKTFFVQCSYANATLLSMSVSERRSIAAETPLFGNSRSGIGSWWHSKRSSMPSLPGACGAANPHRFGAWTVSASRLKITASWISQSMKLMGDALSASMV
jgi:hypothetical protein